MSALEKFYYQVTGQNVRGRIVFLHGLLGSAANWRRITHAFKNNYEILTLDQRGHGRSMQPERGYAPEDYAGDLLMILDELDWDKTHLVGHSMGGRNALVFASQHPERLNSLLIEDIGPEARKEGGDRIEAWLNLVPTPFRNKRKAKEYLLNDFVQSLSGNPQAETLAQYFYTNIETKPDGTADWRFSQKGVRDSIREGRRTERWPELRELSVPTLIIRGERSEELWREVFERMLAENPQLKGVEISDSGHWVHFDQPEAFIKELQNFWDEI